MLSMLAATLFVSLLAFTGIWLIHVRSRNAGVVDYYWGPGFAVIALIEGWMNGYTAASAILTGAVALWSLRLSVYLIVRHRKSGREDGRYAAMRAAGGDAYWWKSLFSVFLLQGLLQWLIASPLHVIFGQSPVGDAASPLFIFGLMLFAAGFAIEWIADSQLAAFKDSHSVPGQLMTSGLWRHTRHPNYLGEMMLWTGIGLAAFSVTHSVFALAGPIILIAVMVLVSIPLTEDHLRRSRPQYSAYMARTPTLLPRLFNLRKAETH